MFTCVCCFPGVDLSLVITPENLAPMLSNPEIRDRLIPYLPAGEELPQDAEQLLLTLQSPHFQQVSITVEL